MWKDDEEYRVLVTRLGPRLRELRRRAGLTQEELSRRMGMSSPNKALMVRIENGRTGNPGLATVGRYLRACRAGFVDVLDVLESYTRQAPVPEARAARAIQELEDRLRGQVRIRGNGEVGSGQDSTTKTQRHEEGGGKGSRDQGIKRSSVRRGDGWR